MRELRRRRVRDDATLEAGARARRPARAPRRPRRRCTTRPPRCWASRDQARSTARWASAAIGSTDRRRERRGRWSSQLQLVCNHQRDPPFALLVRATLRPSPSRARPPRDPPRASAAARRLRRAVGSPVGARARRVRSLRRSRSPSLGARLGDVAHARHPIASRPSRMAIDRPDRAGATPGRSSTAKHQPSADADEPTRVESLRSSATSRRSVSSDRDSSRDTCIWLMPDPARDLRLGQAVEEAQPQDRLLPLGQRREQVADHHLVLDLVHAGLLAAERVAERAVVAGQLRVERLGREARFASIASSTASGSTSSRVGDLGDRRRSAELVGELRRPSRSAAARAPAAPGAPAPTRTGPGSGA